MFANGAPDLVDSEEGPDDQGQVERRPDAQEAGEVKTADRKEASAVRSDDLGLEFPEGEGDEIPAQDKEKVNADPASANPKLG